MRYAHVRKNREGRKTQEEEEKIERTKKVTRWRDVAIYLVEQSNVIDTRCRVESKDLYVEPL